MHGEGVIPFLLIFLSDALCLLSPLLSGSLLRDKFVNRNLQVPRELVVVVNDILRTEGVVEPTVAEAVLDHLLQIAVFVVRTSETSLAPGPSDGLSFSFALGSWFQRPRL